MEMLRTELIRPLHETLEAHATRLGGKIAYSDGRRSITYADLARRTRHLAGHLAAMRVHQGDRVAIYLGNRVEAVESYFAISRASAIGVPFNPSCTDAELAYLIDDSGARVVISDPAHLEQLRRVLLVGRSSRPVRIVLTDVEAVPAEAPEGTVAFAALARTKPPMPARDDLGLDDLAWMLYTSGTTGKPKGVLSTQRNCLWSVAACYAPIPGLSEADKVVWPLPLFHSLAHIVCVLAVASVGASARILDAPRSADILDALRDESATFLVGLPATYHYLVAAAKQRAVDTPSLRMCLVGGAITPADVRREFEQRFGVPLLDVYGSTETCGSITISWPTGARVPGSCGLAVPGLALRLVDPETLLDVDGDAEGEVWVRGPAVMAGYHNQPEATAAAFHRGWYRTGDLARADPAGYLTITGRIKELIIRSGENIHPAEIEEILRGVPGVADAAVAGKPHEVLGEVPVAFVVPGPAGVAPEEIFTACREHLSYFKIPEELYEIPRVPRTASGKVMRRLLLERPARLLAPGGGHFETLFTPGWMPLPSRLPRGEETCSPGIWAVAGPDAAPLAAALSGMDTLAVARAGLAEILAEVAAGGPPPAVVILRDDALCPAGPAVALGRAATRLAALAGQVDSWLAATRLREVPLLVLTRNSVVIDTDPAGGDLAGAAVWGWLRGMQSAHPGRLLLADHDGDTALAECLPRLLARRVSQAGLRRGVILTPQLTRASAPGPEKPPVVEPHGTALITGADGEIAGLIARQLAAAHGVRHFLLTSPRGNADPLAVDLAGELTRAGASARLAAAVPADLHALQAAAATSARQLSMAVLTDLGTPPDGSRDDGDLVRTVEAGLLAADRLGVPTLLVCSGAGQLGDAVDAAESAAAMLVDTFAQRRRAQGASTTALSFAGWGLRGRRSAESSGFREVAAGQLPFRVDAAIAAGRAVLLAGRLDPALVAQEVPQLLRGLVDSPLRVSPPAG